MRQTTSPKLVTEKKSGYLVLVMTDRTCDFTACHRFAVIREVTLDGRAHLQRYLCGFHAAALFGRREA